MKGGEEKFVTAILTQAVDDAKYTGTRKRYLKHKIEAINWIMSDDPEFKYYCSLLNIEPSYIKNKIKITNGTKFNAKQKIMMKPIVKALLKSKTYKEVSYGRI
tara:strand:+ start:226 stop:534 length:309 start_codon:yes stop_codon:yes gene_type:complete